MTIGLNQKDLSGLLLQLPQDDPKFRKATEIQKYRRGQRIASASELVENLYILVSGRACLVRRNDEGRRLVMARLSPGAIFGEGALLDGKLPDTFAEAEQDCTLWALPRPLALEMTQQHPILGWGLLQTSGQRLAEVENRLEDVAYKRLPERLASLLLEVAGDDGDTIEGISHQSLADNLGTYRETVSAILRRFKKGELVDLGYRRIDILNVEGLRDMAGVW